MKILFLLGCTFFLAGEGFVFAATTPPPALPLGATCTRASQCTSKNCTGGVCTANWQDQPCPEQDGLKAQQATIGGNAWNGLLGWIYNFWPPDSASSLSRVSKLRTDTGALKTGGEIFGWSSYARLSSVAVRKLLPLGGSCGQARECLSNNCTGGKCVGGTKESSDTCSVSTECKSNSCVGGICVQLAAPSICWGATCGPLSSDAAINTTYQRYANNKLFCKDPTTDYGCVYPPTRLYPQDPNPDPTLPENAKYYDGSLLKSYAELVYQKTPSDNAQVIKMCTFVVSATNQLAKDSGGTMIVKKCSDTTDPLLTPANPQYCFYPVKGWMKIRQLKDDGWVRLSGRIAGTSIPVPIVGVDPGINYVNWPQRVNCSTDPTNAVCNYQVYYDPSKREFTGWAWSPKVRWISFSGSTLYQTMSLWRNNYICDGATCTTISYDTDTGRSRWNSAFTGVWVQGLGGNLFSKKGFGGIAPPPAQTNTDYLIVTGGYGSTDTSGLTGWESTCNDKVHSPACAAVSRKKFDSTTTTPPDALRTQSLSLAMPQYSQTVNRSAIKRSALGTLNVAVLTPKAGILGEAPNVFGTLVKPITNETGIWNASISGSILSASPLGNKVYFAQGDLVIGSADQLKMIIADMSGGNAGGTIVVRGNIIIRRPIGYSNPSVVANFKGLGSISWIALKYKNAPTATTVIPAQPQGVSDKTWKIVTTCSDDTQCGTNTWNQGGNIIIDDCLPSDITDNASITKSLQMSRIAGVFFAENTFATGAGHGGAGAGECPNLNAPTSTGLPFYYDTPLEIDGIVVAKNILFQRMYRGGLNAVASETIKNTGRYLVNSPPGLTEFAKSLPLW